MAVEIPARNLLSLAEVTTLIDRHFPQMHMDGRIMHIESLAFREAVVRLDLHERNIRPGGTISGPAMFTLADVAVYVAILAELGEPALQAVTTSLNINFLSRPEQEAIRAKTRIIKRGRRLAVGQVELFSTGRSDLIAHATATYALPPGAVR